MELQRPSVSWTDLERPPALLVLGYGAILLVGVAIWIAIVAIYRPTVDAGIAAMGVAVGYIAAGINAWFLIAVLRQLRVTRDELRVTREELRWTRLESLRAASPYIRFERRRTTDDGRMLLRPTNHGEGIAREVSVWQAVLKPDGTKLRVEFAHGRVETCFPNGPPRSTWMLDRTNKIVDDPALELEDSVEYQRVVCYDELYRYHKRWFRRAGGTLLEIAGGVAPEGALRTPSWEVDPVVTWLEEELPNEGE